LSNITPWNPCKYAIKKVKHPSLPPKICIYCNSDVEIVNNKDIYGKSYGKWPWVYLCKNCGSFVGIHLNTNIPLGNLADTKTRKARIESKEPFMNLYKSGRITIDDAYLQLSKKLKIPLSECHFGLFNVDMCKKAAIAAREIFFENQ
jgi:hypothetical protein